MNNLIKKVSIIIYLFFLLGFILHQSQQPVIFHKYTVKYIFGLLFLILLFIPYIYLIKFTQEKTKLVLFKKKRIIGLPTKIIFYFGIAIVFLIGIEISIRNNEAKNKILRWDPVIENYHPFLQNQLSVVNNKSIVNLHIDSEGFRYDEVRKEKKKGTIRIFVLGGSTVLSVEEPYEKNLVRLLEKNLRMKYPEKHIEVINAGNSWYTSEHSLIQYLFKIRDFHPDMIIVWQGINDLYNSCSPENFARGSYKSDYSHFYGVAAGMVFETFQQKPFISVNLSNFFPRGTPQRSLAIQAITTFFRRNFYSDVVDIYIHKFPNKLPYPIKTHNFPSINAFSRNMNYMVSITKSDNVKLILANQPYLYDMKYKNRSWFVQDLCTVNNEYPDTASLIYGINLFNDASKKIANKNNIQFVDLASQIPKKDEYFLDDVHFTEKGNKKVADVLYTFIVNNHLIN